MTGVSKIIVYNSKNEFLLQLREDGPGTGFSTYWDLIGKAVEELENPANAARRELLKTLGIYIENPVLFRVHNDGDTKHHIFAAKIDAKVSELNLGEGVEVRWFRATELNNTRMAFNYRAVLWDFIKINNAAGMGQQNERTNT